MAEPAIIAGLIGDKNAGPDLTGRLNAITANTLVVWGATTASCRGGMANCWRG